MQVLVVLDQLLNALLFGFADPIRSIKYDHPDLSGAELARRLGLSRATVNSIRRGDSWSHI